jgi:putative transposase
MQSTEPFDFDSFKQEAMKELYKGKPLMGENGIFTPLLKHFLEATLQGEMDTHLKQEQAKSNPNRRNGTGKKQVRSSLGKFDLETPRDRASNYEPTIVPKRQTILTDQLESIVCKGFDKKIENVKLELPRFNQRFLWRV